MTGCLNESILQAWLDDELTAEAAAAARAHLAGCAVCAAKTCAAEKTLTLVDDAWHAELKAVFPTADLRDRVDERLAKRLAAQAARVDRPWWWQMGFGQRRIGGAIAVLAIAVAGAIAIRSREDATPTPQTALLSTMPTPDNSVVESAPRLPNPSVRRAPRPTQLQAETNRHLEQTQLLLRSVRNTDTEADSDLAYERELSRELLTRNRLLRRRAEQKGERRAEEFLSQIEPLLLDIANLPEQPVAEEMRSLKDLIRDQHIIAELQLYSGKHLF
jgi:hypothetical protein